jgi:hypothetical protein
MIRDGSAPVPEWFRAVSVLSIIPAGALGGYLAQMSKGLGAFGTDRGGRPPMR